MDIVAVGNLWGGLALFGLGFTIWGVFLRLTPPLLAPSEGQRERAEEDKIFLATRRPVEPLKTDFVPARAQRERAAARVESAADAFPPPEALLGIKTPQPRENPIRPVLERTRGEIVPRSKGDMEQTFAPIVRKAAPAVVNVYSRKIISDRSPLFDDPVFRRFFGDEQGGVPRERVQSALGSGVIVRADGVIVTNHHVVAGADELIVALADRREFQAKVILDDERTDLAVLKLDVKGKPLPVLDFRDSDDAEVGDLVLAIGNPFGVGQTVTSGIISALARTQVGISDFQFFIQTDAAINPGNSGGALVTMDGKLIGINTAIFSRTGGSVGIGFAIPANMVKLVVNSALAGGGLVRPWLGVSGEPVTAEKAQQLGLERPTGVIVHDVFPGSPADKAGLKAGDVIVSIDGLEVHDPQGLRYRVGTQPVGKNVTVTFVRKGQTRTAEARLDGPPEDPPRTVQNVSGNHPLDGTKVGNLSPAFAEELGIDSWLKGVIVLDVKPGSAASRVRIKPGDIVAAVNGMAVPTVDALLKCLTADIATWQLTIRRGGQAFTIQASR
jgi:Do/DeqQ family serine protease